MGDVWPIDCLSLKKCIAQLLDDPFHDKLKVVFTRIWAGPGSVTKNAEEALASNVGDVAKSSETPLADAALTYLDVVVFGLGSEPVGDESAGDKPNGN